uniref:Nuclear pore complex protein Nup85 n=1 Tax=Glossina pallidipes TaxID=7398 RepID=A0A1B0AC66_GLOPL
MEQHQLNDCIKLRDSVLYELGSNLMTRNSLWQFGVDYLEYCAEQDRFCIFIYDLLPTIRCQKLLIIEFTGSLGSVNNKLGSLMSHLMLKNELMRIGRRDINRTLFLLQQPENPRDYRPTLQQIIVTEFLSLLILLNPAKYCQKYIHFLPYNNFFIVVHPFKGNNFAFTDSRLHMLGAQAPSLNIKHSGNTLAQGTSCRCINIPIK